MLVVEASGRELITSYKFIDLLVKKGGRVTIAADYAGGKCQNIDYVNLNGP